MHGMEVDGRCEKLMLMNSFIKGVAGHELKGDKSSS